MPPDPSLPKPRPEELPRYSGNWLNESSGQAIDTLNPPPEVAHELCDCALDWITLQPSDHCQHPETS